MLHSREMSSGTCCTQARPQPLLWPWLLLWGLAWLQLRLWPWLPPCRRSPCPAPWTPCLMRVAAASQLKSLVGPLGQNSPNQEGEATSRSGGCASGTRSSTRAEGATFSGCSCLRAPEDNLLQHAMTKAPSPHVWPSSGTLGFISHSIRSEEGAPMFDLPVWEATPRGREEVELARAPDCAGTVSRVRWHHTCSRGRP